MSDLVEVSSDLLGLEEVAPQLRCCSKTVSNLIKKGLLQSVQVGRRVYVRMEIVEQFKKNGGGRLGREK